MPPDVAPSQRPRRSSAGRSRPLLVSAAAAMLAGAATLLSRLADGHGADRATEPDLAAAVGLLAGGAALLLRASRTAAGRLLAGIGSGAVALALALDGFRHSAGVVLSLALLAAALLGLALRVPRARAVDGLALAAGLLALASLLTHLYGGQLHLRLAMSLPASIGFLALAAAVIASNPGGPLMRALSGRRASSIVARRLIAAALLAIPLLGRLHVWVVEQGWLERHESFSLLVASELLIVGAAILGATRLLERLERERERLAEADHRLAGVVEQASEAIVSVDLEGRVTSWNPSARRLFGYRAEDVLGESAELLFPPGDRERFEDILAGILARPLQYEARRCHRDGRLLEVGVTAWPLLDAGTLVGGCAMYRDLGERERARRELESMVEQRTRDVEASREEMLQRLALVAEYRDDDTFQHTERVGRLAASLGRQLGLDDERVALLRRAAPLHDIGKLAVSDVILRKPGPLTPTEFEIVKHHTTAGGRILAGSSSEVLGLAQQIAVGHHERWDGDGYPGGVAGEDIPLAARIVAVADVYDALTHARPYKAAWGHGEAIAEIARGAGTQFDPTVVAALLALDAAGAVGKPGAARVLAS